MIAETGILMAKYEDMPMGLADAWKGKRRFEIRP